MSLYRVFGFKSNVFDTTPLSPIAEDVKSFVGRADDINSFMVDISAENRSLVLVTGVRGVGKTSFVNTMEFACSQNEFHFENDPIKESQLVPCFHKVQIDPNETINSLLFKCTSSLIYSLTTQCRIFKVSFPEILKNTQSWIQDIAPVSLSGSFGTMGFSAGGGKTKQMRSYADIPVDTYCQKIKEIIDEAKEVFGCKGIFLNINNIEIVSEDLFITLVEHLRDYLFEIEGLWLVLIGYPGMYTTLANKAPRVADIVNGQETLLKPLCEDEVIEILNLRAKALSIDDGAMPEIISQPSLPIEEEFIRQIYQNSDGEIRAILKACDDIVRAVFKSNPSTAVITKEIGKPYLTTILQKKIGIESLKSKEKEIVTKLLKIGKIRPKQFKELSLKSSVDFTNRARPLLEKNILKKEVEGNSAEYSVTGTVKLAKFCGLSFTDD